jgi:hypothetical protein
MLIPILWYAYAKWFNAVYHNDYLFLSVQPVWKMPLYDIGLTCWRIAVSWSATYFWRPTSVMLLITLFYFLIKKQSGKLQQIILLTFLIDLLFAVLFFNKLTVHEYYYAFFYINILFVLIGFLSLLKKIKHQNLTKTALIIFIGVNIFYCKNYVAGKQTVARIDQKLFSPSFQDFLNQSHCTKNKTVFCYDDFSTNQELYAIKRKGITQHNKNWELYIKNKQIDFILVREQFLHEIAKQVEIKTVYEYGNYRLAELFY